MVVAEDPPASVKRLLIEFARPADRPAPQRGAEFFIDINVLGVGAEDPPASPQSPRPGCPTPTPAPAPPSPCSRSTRRSPASRRAAAHLADELAELLKDAERYAAAAQDTDPGAPGSENNPPLDRLPRMEARLGALSNTFR